MGETKKQTHRIKISGRVVAVFAALMAIAVIAALFVIPQYGKTVSSYREQRSLYKTAAGELEAAQTSNSELTARLEEMQTMAKETEDLQKDVFKLAASLEKDIQDGKSAKRICYITVDDGPYNRGNEFLKLFRKYDVKATFFLTTANGDKLPDKGELSARSMYPEYLKYGHTIGNHTYSHNYSSGGVYSSADAFMESVNEQTEFTKEATGGYEPDIVRLPGGISMAGSELEAIEESMRKAGYGWIDWTVDSGDSWGDNNITVKKIKQNVLDAAGEQKIMVVLFHEWSGKTLKAMPDIIEKLEERGYIFLPLFKDSVMVNK
ncbi:MAG: hypothetical protein E7220_01365 [Clostridiales bacterium]|nr:hypothetical protein [Clostridiales bacterium]